MGSKEKVVIRALIYHQWGWGSNHRGMQLYERFVLCGLSLKNLLLYITKFTLNILDEELWVNLQPLTITILIIINK